MINLLRKLANCFRAKPVQKKPALKPKLSLDEPNLNFETKSIKTKHFNYHHYRQLIGKLASKGIAIQRHRTQRRNC